MSPDQATLVVSQISSVITNFTFWSAIAHIIMGGVIILLMKYVSECIVAKIKIKMDDFIRPDAPIEVKGRKGRIKEINWTKVVVEYPNYGHQHIPINEFKGQDYILLNDKALNGDGGKKDGK